MWCYLPGSAIFAADDVSAGQEECVDGLVHTHAARQRLRATPAAVGTRPGLLEKKRILLEYV